MILQWTHSPARTFVLWPLYTHFVSCFYKYLLATRFLGNYIVSCQLYPDACFMFSVNKELHIILTTQFHLYKVVKNYFSLVLQLGETFTSDYILTTVLTHWSKKLLYSDLNSDKWTWPTRSICTLNKFKSTCAWIFFTRYYVTKGAMNQPSPII